MPKEVSLKQKVFQDPAYFIAFGFGSGLMPKAPGTFGTLAGLPIYLLLQSTPWYVYLFSTILAFILGVYVSNKVSNDLGLHDYQGIVWDEVVGLLLTLFLVPVGFWYTTAGVILFRVFDIWKPEPIGYFDRKVKGGLGIMLDDVVAAIGAWLFLQLLLMGFRA